MTSGVERGQSGNFCRYAAFLILEADTRKWYFKTTQNFLRKREEERREWCYAGYLCLS